VLVYPNPLGGDRRIGTTLRFRGGERSPWRIVWVGATSGAFAVLDGRTVEEDIVIEGADPSGARVRAVFSEIARERFELEDLLCELSAESFASVSTAGAQLRTRRRRTIAEETKRILSERLAEPPTLAALAALFACSRFFVSRAFRMHVGLSMRALSWGVSPSTFRAGSNRS
jgi:hypothetical protein